MTARVDPDVCIGCTLCTQVCPEIFKMEGDKAIAHKDPVPYNLKETCERAAEECPVNAIIIEA